MAYSLKDLNTEWIPGIDYIDGSGVISLSDLKSAILEEAERNEIRVAFMEDELKIGGPFSSKREKILIMFHPEHSWDYLRFAIRIEDFGTHAFVSIFNLGGSKNYQNENDARDGKAFRKMLNSLGSHGERLRQEEIYYSILKGCLRNAMNSFCE